MTDELQQLIARSRGVKMTSDEAEKQRRSFAYGNSKIENARISRKSIDKAAKTLANKNGSNDNKR